MLNGAVCLVVQTAESPGVLLVLNRAVCLVVQTAGFSYIELNASDTRSKRSLHEDVAEALNNHTLVDFFGQCMVVYYTVN